VTGTVEKHSVLDIHDLHRRRLLTERTLVFSASLRWSWLDRLSVDRWCVQLRFPSGGSQSIAVTWSRCHFGGMRPWFVCPHCHRRVGKLYNNRGSYCACRLCYELRYASQRRGAKSRRWLQALKLRLRLNGIASLAQPFPERPRGMHQKTYARLRSRAEQLEAPLRQNRRWTMRKTDYSVLISQMI
jgi:hypothetical protein